MPPAPCSVYVANQERDYYHINRLVKWTPYDMLSAGDEVDGGGLSNPYFRFYETQGIVYSLPTAAHAVEEVPGIAFL